MTRYDTILDTIRDKVRGTNPDLAHQLDRMDGDPIDVPARVREMIDDSELYGISEEELVELDTCGYHEQVARDEWNAREPRWMRI